jgi:SAM-dependent methyltransferase
VNRELPFPGDDLAFRVAGTADRDWFFKSGRQSAEDIAAILGVVRREPQAHGRILDFGCGCGRVLLWLKDLADDSSLHGIDIDAAAIDWARTHLPYVNFAVNNPLPPTGFPDAFFDLIYCHSVFTHIDETFQDAWLGELQRIVKPDGLLLLSVCGDYAFQQFEDSWRRVGADPSAHRARLDQLGLLYIAEDSWTGGPFPDFYHSAFHTPSYIFAHWSRYFRIRAYVPQGSLSFQDYVLLERVDPQPVAQRSSDQSGRSRFVRVLERVRTIINRVLARPAAPARMLKGRLARGFQRVRCAENA